MARLSRRPALRSLREAARGCRACPLWKNATQTVFGAGPARAKVVLVGEQPGDQEDRIGLPFVGPAGRMLDKALQQAGVERSELYVTNAVKHFKFLLRGKRRMHQKPTDLEIAACHRWLEKELASIRPHLIVAMGATAARSVFGRTMRIEANRGHIMPPDSHSHAADVLITVHPSWLLRVPEADKADAFRGFVRDLRRVRRYVAET
jgi:DNA polymerase